MDTLYEDIDAAYRAIKPEICPRCGQVDFYGVQDEHRPHDDPPISSFHLVCATCDWETKTVWHIIRYPGQDA